MKKLLILALFGLMTSCMAPEYTAKDRDGSPILIKDTKGIIADVLSLNLDSIYVVKYSFDDYYEPLRRMGKNETNFWADSVNGKKVHITATYRIIHTNNIIKR
jgi:hypothetical protein